MKKRIIMRKRKFIEICQKINQSLNFYKYDLIEIDNSFGKIINIKIKDFDNYGLDIEDFIEFI